MDGFELYDPHHRWRHRHPLEKAALALGMLFLAVALPPGIVTAAIFLLVTAAALIAARVSWRRFLSGVAIPTGFLSSATLAVLLSFVWNEGDAWPSLHFEIAAATKVFLRGLAAITCLVFFATTTSLPEVLSLLRAVRCPEFVVELMMLTYRFAASLMQTARTMHRAQHLRLGFGTPEVRFRSLGQLGANLLPRSIDLSMRLARGLETRGYEGHLPVLSVERPLSWSRLAAILALELALAGLGVFEARSGVP